MFEFRQNGGEFEIKGHLFFKEIGEEEVLGQLKAYAQNPKKQTSFYFKIHYLDGQRAINFIVKVCRFVQTLPATNNTYWVYHEEDEDGKALAEDIIEEFGVPLILMPVDDSSFFSD